MEEVTLERDDTIHANYPFLFEEEDQILPKQWELLAGMNNSGKLHWEAVKWILRYLRGITDKVLCFKGGDTILTGW